MTWHIIDGEAGCAFAVRHGLAAVIVDALRASATAAMLFEHDATQIRVVRDVEEAYAAKRADPQALLFGERGGLPPEGFDGGNSPRETARARGHRVIFTTTNGTRCLVAAKGAPLVLFASTTNATATAAYALAHAQGVVLVPAGSPQETATEDRAAAALIAKAAGVSIGEGQAIYAEYEPYLNSAGMLGVFQSASHADVLRAVGLDDDIAYCAQIDLTDAVPCVTRYEGAEAILKDGRVLTTESWNANGNL